jgi:MarR family transcriptional regulator for hemolysin
MDDFEETPLGKLFNQLTKGYVGTFSKRLENLPIKRHFYALMLIYKANGKWSQTDLASELQMDKVSILRMVDYLSEHGCVKRKTNPLDRRGQLLHCTDKGSSLIPAISDAMIETNTLCLDGFTAKETLFFEKMLFKVGFNLQHQPQDIYNIKFIKKDK